MAKPAFDPSKPYEPATSGQKPAFDESQPFEIAKPISTLESAGKGLIKGASLGFDDELSGGLEAIGSSIGIRGLGQGLDKIRLETPEEKSQSFKDVYKTQRDIRRSSDVAASEQNPKSYLAGTLLGSTALPGVSTIRGAAGIGAIAGLGSSSSDDLGDQAIDAATGGLMGIGFGVLGKGLEKASSKAIQKYANNKAAKASGLMAKDYKKMTQEQVEQYGRDLLESKIVGFWDDLESIGKKAGQARKKSGSEIGDMIDSADNLTSEAKNLVDQGAFGELNDASKIKLKKQIDDQFQFGMQRVGQKIMDKLITPNKNNPTLSSELSKLYKLASEFDSLGPQTLKQGRQIKSAQGKVTKFNPDGTIPEAFKKEVYGIIKDELEDTMGKMGYLESAVARAKGVRIDDLSPEELGNQISQAFKNANKKYGVATTAEKAAKGRLSDVNKNRGVGLYEIITGTGGGAVGALAGGTLLSSLGLGTIGALAVGGLTKLAKNYGNSTIAKSAHNIAKIMAKSPKALGKFREILENATKNGSLALTATHMQLLKDPEYRQISGIGDD